MTIFSSKSCHVFPPGDFQTCSVKGFEVDQHLRALCSQLGFFSVLMLIRQRALCDFEEFWGLRSKSCIYKSQDWSHFSPCGDGVLIPQLEPARVISTPFVVCVCVSVCETVCVWSKMKVKMETRDLTTTQT